MIKQRGYLYGTIDKIRDDHITLKLRLSGAIVTLLCPWGTWNKSLNNSFNTWVMNDITLKVAVAKKTEGVYVYQKAYDHGEDLLKSNTRFEKNRQLVRELTEVQVTVGGPKKTKQNYGTQHSTQSPEVKKKEKPKREICAAMIGDVAYPYTRRCKTKAVIGSRYCRVHTIKPTEYPDYDDPKYQTKEPKPFDARWDMPRTPQEALEVLKVWGRQDTMTFSYSRARRMYELLNSVGRNT